MRWRQSYSDYALKKIPLFIFMYICLIKNSMWNLSVIIRKKYEYTMSIISSLEYLWNIRHMRTWEMIFPSQMVKILHSKCDYPLLLLLLFTVIPRFPSVAQQESEFQPCLLRAPQLPLVALLILIALWSTMEFFRVLDLDSHSFIVVVNWSL